MRVCTSLFTGRGLMRRTPHGVRPSLKAPQVFSRHFNPRTQQGATRKLQPRAGGRPASIHAPMLGVTKPRQSAKVIPFWLQSTRFSAWVRSGLSLDVKRKYYFNPRTPCGVRPLASFPCQCTADTSIHAPPAGATRTHHPDAESAPTSIHAPLRGATVSCCSYSVYIDYFNPRTPCRARLTNLLRIIL